MYTLTVLLNLSGLSTDISSLRVVDAQRISDSVKNVKVFGPGPLISLKDEDLSSFSLSDDDPSSPLASSSLSSPVIRVAGANDRVVQDAYWIDFASDFDQHDRFSQWVQSQGPGLVLIRHEFWGEPLNAISLEVKDAALLKEIVGLFPGIKLVEPVVSRVFVLRESRLTMGRECLFFFNLVAAFVCVWNLQYNFSLGGL